MDSKTYVLDTLRSMGLAEAERVQSASFEMTGTEINGEKEYIPDFKEAVKAKNMLERKAGKTDGFVCMSTAGRVVRLIQNYDSNTYTQEPEDLPAQWGFVWSNDPVHALPFVAISTSPYMKGDVCIGLDKNVYRSKIDNNTWEPTSYLDGWEKV